MTTSPVVVAVASLLGFVLGSVNPAVLIARARGTDLRAAGSGNPGATNAGRVLGPRWGVLVAVLDVLKGLVPVLVAVHLYGPRTAYLVGLAAVLGHVWSPFLRGRGGKGVATAFGTVLGVHWAIALVLLGLFVLAATVFRRVGAGSVTAGACLVLLGVLVVAQVPPGWLDHPREAGLFLAALGTLVLARHYRNMRGWAADAH